MGNLISFMKKVADGLRESGNYGTAHIYRSSMSAILAFNESGNLPFRKVTPEFLKSFEAYLRGRNCSWNTVSTYMRMLRSVYNRGVESGRAPYVPRLFHDVYTGVDIRQKRALPVPELHKLLYEDPKTDRLRRTQAIAGLMFQFCGMSFADLAHLEKSALNMAASHTSMDSMYIGGAVKTIQIIAFWLYMLADIFVYEFSLCHNLMDLE